MIRLRTRLSERFLGLAMSAIAAIADPAADGLRSTIASVHSVRLDNGRRAVLEYRLKPGGKEVMHSHPRRNSICA